MTKTFHQPILQRDANDNVIQESFLSGLKFRGEYSGTNLIYKGAARPGSATSAAVWQICKITYSGANLVQVDWPEDSNGGASEEYVFVWDDRATYTYN